MADGSFTADKRTENKYAGKLGHAYVWAKSLSFKAEPGVKVS